MLPATKLEAAATVNSTVPSRPAVAYTLMSARPVSCCQMVCASRAMMVTAARNRALRGGSRKARLPTGSSSSRPKPLATPPQACSNSISARMSSAAWMTVCT